MSRYQNPAAGEAYAALAADLTAFPISFVYNGETVVGFPKDIMLETDRKVTETRGRTDTSVTFDLKGELTVRLLYSYYPSHGVTEWTVWFENNTDRNSGVISDVKTTLSFTGDKPILKGILGDHINQYRPYESDLSEAPVHFTSDSGRPTHINFPYFNLEYGDGGAMLAIGWAGTWTADFTATDDGAQVVMSSTNGLKTYLKPGESIRTALYVLAPYTIRDENYATNFWRSWFIECSMPRADSDGNAVQPFSASCISGDTGMPNSDGSISERYWTWKPSLDKMIAEDVKVDFRWFDAGWYIAPDGTSPIEDWWGTVGTWELDKNKWPGDTFLQSTEYARQHGMKTLMWFEPERVTHVDDMVKNFGYKREWAIEGDGGIVNDIGNKECLAATTKRICDVLRENKVEMYREDNNFNPGPIWKRLDAENGPDRDGFIEIAVVTNHYQMWDDIIDCTLSFGGCGFVDSCASGGGRNDLESLRRGIPLLRSDADRTTTALRLSMSYGFNKWIPFCGASTKDKSAELSTEGISDAYSWRASYLPVLNVSSRYVFEKEEKFDDLRFGLKEWKKVSRYLLKDFYTHTPWHSKDDRTGFTAFSYIDPDDETGILTVFRMEDCEDDTVTLNLPYLAEGKVYELKDEDTGEVITLTGKEYLTLTLTDKRTSKLYWISVKK